MIFEQPRDVRTDANPKDFVGRPKIHMTSPRGHVGVINFRKLPSNVQNEGKWMRNGNYFRFFTYCYANLVYPFTIGNTDKILSQLEH